VTWCASGSSTALPVAPRNLFNALKEFDDLRLPVSVSPKTWHDDRPMARRVRYPGRCAALERELTSEAAAREVATRKRRGKGPRSPSANKDHRGRDRASPQVRVLRPDRAVPRLHATTPMNRVTKVPRELGMKHAAGAWPQDPFDAPVIMRYKPFSTPAPTSPALNPAP